MAPSSRSPADVHDDIRHHPHLPLHHRARFPSLTEFPDSPSVYSHAYYSPDADVYANTASFSRLSGSPRCPDFDDEAASTIRSLSTEDLQDDSDVDECTDDASHRISLRGPRIRFHSRAPWETDDDIPHGENNSRSATVGNKLKERASRADNLIRTFTRGSSITSRPSVESTRSQASVTSSFEVTAGNYSSSRGVLYDLAKQSMSTSSLASSATSASGRSQNFARAINYQKNSHYFTRAHDTSSRATVSLDGMVPGALESAPMVSSSFDVPRTVHECSLKSSLVSLSQERQLHDQFVHPYANPDLVPCDPLHETIPSDHPTLGDIGGSDSTSTVTESTSPISAEFSVSSTDTSTTSLTSRDTPHGNLRVNGKEISSPVSVLRQNDTSYVGRSTKFLSLHPPPSGFEDPLRNNQNPRLPAVTLISLQEAQARERFRSSTVHTAMVRSKLPFPSSDDIHKATEDQTVEKDTSGRMVHTRARSTSSGTRHRTATLPPAEPQNVEIRGETAVSTPAGVVSGRTLKHKKSGFLRLFGGRNSEGEKERSPPLPIPHLTDVYAEESLPTYGTGKASKLTLSRVSNSSFSPTLHGSGASNATLASTYSASSDGDGSSSRRRQPPSLSIVTKPSDHSIATSVSGKGSPMGLNFTPPPLSLTVPQSAPPGNSDFPGLKLRPVSSSFSSHFADMVTETVEEPCDADTPSSAASSNTALSPFTPISIPRNDDASATIVEVLGEECLTIKGLQEQLVSAKKAWQQQVWELRGQIRDLNSEVEGLRAADNKEYCEVCGRGEPRKQYASPLDEQQRKKVGIVNRPRARTGDTARFASGN